MAGQHDFSTCIVLGNMTSHTILRQPIFAENQLKILNIPFVALARALKGYMKAVKSRRVDYLNDTSGPSTKANHSSSSSSSS